MSHMSDHQLSDMWQHVRELMVFPLARRPIKPNVNPTREALISS